MLFWDNFNIIMFWIIIQSFLDSLIRFWDFDEFIRLVDSWVLGQGNIQLSAKLSESAIAVIENI